MINKKSKSVFTFVAMMFAAIMVMGCKANVNTGTQGFAVAFSAVGGTVSAKVDGKEIKNGALIAAGKTVTFTAHPQNGMKVARWIGIDNTGDKVTVSLTVNAAVSVTAECTAITHTVAFTQPEHGTLKATVDGEAFTGGTVQKGKTVVFIAAPADGYRVKQWTGTDNPASTDNTAVLTVKENATVSVEFESTAIPMQTFTVSFIQPKLGSLKAQLDGEPFTGGEVEKGKVIVFTADIPDACRIKQWKGTDTPAQTSALATLTVSAAVTVSVELEYDNLVNPSFLTIKDGVLEKCAPAADGVVEIPANVTAIKDEAFKNCQYITGVIIPNSVTHIGEKAFYQCRRLTTVTIPDSVTSIGESAFSSCQRLRSITLPKDLTVIEKSMFYRCDNLEKVQLPENLISIEDEAFIQCENLKSIQIPEKVQNIGNKTFYICSRLKHVSIPETVQTIGSQAFGVCSNLTAITIPKNLTEIKDGTFSNCTKLKSLNWEDLQVQTIGARAFYECSFTDIILPKTVKRVDGSAFERNRKLESIKITGEEITLGELVFFLCDQLKQLDIAAQRCNFYFQNYGYNRHYKLFSYGRALQQTYITGYETIGSVPSGLKVTVKVDAVKNKLADQGGIPAGQITVDPNLE